MFCVQSFVAKQTSVEIPPLFRFSIDTYFDLINWSNLQAKELGTKMLELWSLMGTPVEEQRVFQHVTCLIPASEEEIVGPSSLSVETIEEVGWAFALVT
jgi:hypothetical protein